MPSFRVTQQDIARALGVHRSTVSLALQNHPSISKETRAQVLKTAETLGYQPDPMLSALSAYRSRRHPAIFGGTLAWLVSVYKEYDWRKSPHYRDYLDGANARAEQSGYKMEIFTIDPDAMPARRVASILRARNIRGLLVCPQPHAHMNVEFPWEDFAAVSFGYTLASPRLHTIAAAHYRSVRLCLAKMRTCGYKRIGLAISQIQDTRVDHSYSSAFLGEALASGFTPLPPYLDDHFWTNPPSFKAWFEQYRPDAILTNSYEILNILKTNGIAAPEEVGVACASLPSPDSHLSGVLEDSRHIGAVATDRVVSMIMHDERGIPSQPQRIHVEGVWNPGDSLRTDHCSSEMAS